MGQEAQGELKPWGTAVGGAISRPPERKVGTERKEKKPEALHCGETGKLQTDAGKESSPGLE